MKTLRFPDPAIFFTAVLAASEDIFHKALKDLTREFGPIDAVFGPKPFTHTKYYENEMGASLIKGFIAFTALFPPGHLAEAKLTTRFIERKYLQPASRTETPKRTVNIDPGLLTPAQVILATGKNFSHRIYLSSGVYAEVTLIYHKVGWETLNWTYPDFKNAEVQTFFSNLRERLRR